MIRVIDQTIKLTPRDTTSRFTPIFVLGCPRSGTTLVGECIGKHSQVKACKEFLFLRYFWQMLLDLHLEQTCTSMASLTHVDTADFIDYVGQFADNIYSSGITTEGHYYIVDHSPWNAAMLPLINAIYPTAVIINLVRHPVAVSQSLRYSYEKGREWASDCIVDHAQLWNDMTIGAVVHANTLALENFASIEYEFLCSSPLETLKQLIGFCELAWEDNCLQALTKNHAGGRTAKTIGLNSTKHYNDDTLLSAIQAYQSHCDYDHFKAITAAGCEFFGYEV